VLEMGHRSITTGRQLAELVNGRIIPSIEQLLARWDKLYPAVKNAPLLETLVCDSCGHRLDASAMSDPDCRRRAIVGRHLGHPDSDSPDEYVTICPECGAAESFREIPNAG